MSRKGRPFKCASYLPVESREELAASAFTRRSLYHRFLKFDTDMSERTFYRLMEGKPSREEYINQVESAIDVMIREPKVVLSRIRRRLSDDDPSRAVLTRPEATVLVPLLNALQ